MSIRITLAAVLLLTGSLPQPVHAQSSDLLWVRGGQGKGNVVADLSPDGTRMATGHEWDGWIRLWDVESAGMLMAFNPRKQYGGATLGVRFSRDGSRLATVGNDSVLRVFDGRSGMLLDSLASNRSVTSVEFSLTGDTLLVGDATGFLHFVLAASMDVAGGNRLSEYAIRRLYLLPTGERFLGITTFGAAFLADARTGALLDTLPVVFDRQLAYNIIAASTAQLPIALGPDKMYIGSAEGDGVLIFDAATGDSVGSIVANVGAVDISPAGDTLFLFGPKRTWEEGGTDNEWILRVWLPETGQFVDSITVLWDEKILSEHGQINLWRMMPDRRSYQVQASAHLGLAMIAPIDLMAQIEPDGTAPAKYYTVGAASVTAIRAIDSGHMATAASGGPSYRLLNVETGRDIERIDNYGAGSCMNFSPDGRTRIEAHVADENGSVTAWIDPGRRLFPLSRIYSNVGEVPQLWISDGGRLVAHGVLVPIPGLAGKVLLTDGVRIDTVCSNALLSTSSACAFSFGNDPLLAVARVGSTVILYEIATRSGRDTVRLSAQPISLVFSADNRLLACGRADGVISLIDPSSGTVIGEMRGHAGRVNDVQFARSGRWLVSAGDDSTVRTWEIATLENDYTYRDYRERFLSVGATPDGRYILAGGEDMALVCFPGREGIASVDEPESDGRIAISVEAVFADGVIETAFSLARPGNVEVELIDIAGRVARSLHSFQEAGRVRITLPAETLPSGLYFVRIRAGHEILTGRVVVRR